jgi:hypothetical protein
VAKGRQAKERASKRKQKVSQPPIILDSAVDSRKEEQRNTDAKILGPTRQVNGFLMEFPTGLFFAPFCGNSNRGFQVDERISENSF